MSNSATTGSTVAGQPAARPSVLFVCVKNGGKSQMAAALMGYVAGDQVEVHSAGTQPGESVNALSATALGELSPDLETDMRSRTPQAIDPALRRRVDRTVVLGTDAQLDPLSGAAGLVEVWETDEPSARGIDGLDRMRLIRDDILARCEQLRDELLA